MGIMFNIIDTEREKKPTSGRSRKHETDLFDMLLHHYLREETALNISIIDGYAAITIYQLSEASHVRHLRPRSLR